MRDRKGKDNMKIWERINEVKGTSETVGNIRNWMVDNKVCPLMISDGLEEDEQPDLQEAAEKHCMEYNDCGPGCYGAYLEREL